MTAAPGCFFFSGPDGRDDRLVGRVVFDRAEIENGAISLKIAGATFTGTYRDHELRVARQSTHEFSGAWKVTEELHGRVAAGVFRGEYHYEECEIAARSCPGSCTISARITFQP